MTTIAVVGSTFTYYLPGLEDQANPGKFKAAPTIASGDFTISTNGGAFEAMDNTPTVTPAGGTQIKFVLSIDETTAAGDGGQINIKCSDTAGAEWYDVGICVPVRAADLSTLGGTAQTGDAYAIVNHATYGNAHLARTGADSDTLETLSDQLDLVGGGATTYSYSDTIDDGSGNLLDGVFVQCATDTGFTNIVSTATTNSVGAFTVYSDTAGTHYLRLQFSGITFAIQTVTLA